MSECCLNAGNRDVEFVVPAIISCIARPDEVQECIHKLSATTFVQAVETPVLSILVPLLIRGLRERVTAIKRKSSVILDNMAKVRTAGCGGLATATWVELRLAQTCARRFMQLCHR